MHVHVFRLSSDQPVGSANGNQQWDQPVGSAIASRKRWQWDQALGKAHWEATMRSSNGIRNGMRKDLLGAACREARRTARKELWDLRHIVAGIEELFALEAKVPDDILLETNTE